MLRTFWKGSEEVTKIHKHSNITFWNRFKFYKSLQVTRILYREACLPFCLMRVLVQHKPHTTCTISGYTLGYQSGMTSKAIHGNLEKRENIYTHTPDPDIKKYIHHKNYHLCIFLLKEHFHWAKQHFTYSNKIIIKRPCVEHAISKTQSPELFNISIPLDSAKPPLWSLRTWLYLSDTSYRNI